jgi:hypothetical protein
LTALTTRYARRVRLLVDVGGAGRAVFQMLSRRRLDKIELIAVTTWENGTAYRRIGREARVGKLELVSRPPGIGRHVNPEGQRSQR